jgi:hypothetical protein
MLLKINMNLYTILHMYLGLSAKWKANTYNKFYNMVKMLVITKDKLSTVLKMCHNSSGHQGVNKTIIGK